MWVAKTLGAESNMVKLISTQAYTGGLKDQI